MIALSTQEMKSQMSGATPVNKIARLAVKIQQGRRARRDLSKQIAYLKSLDEHLLADMGVDIKRLHGLNPTIVSIDSGADLNRGSPSNLGHAVSWWQQRFVVLLSRYM